MKKIFLLLFVSLLTKISIGQAPNLLTFGKPFAKPNIIDLKIVVPSFNCNDKTAVLIDQGQLSATGVPLHCFKVMFVDLQSNQCESVEVKENSSSNPIADNIGTPSDWIIGGDGKIYVGTSGGGHVVKIDCQKRTATDLGNPFNFANNTSSITKMTLGGDFIITGAINDGSIGSYVFRYDYNCSFTKLTPQVIDPTIQNVSEIASDLYYTFVKFENGASTKLYRVNNKNNFITEIVQFDNNTPVSGNPFTLEVYGSDYVYAKAIINNSTKHFQFNSENPTIFLIKEQSPKPVGKKAKDFWVDLFKNCKGITTVFNDYTEKLSYNDNGTIGEVDLSNCVQSYSAPTKVFAPYVNGQTNSKELFIHGCNDMKAASLDYNNNNINFLGDNLNYFLAYSAIPDFDNNSVLIGGYPAGIIQKYESKNNWSLSNNNPTIVYNTYYVPTPTNRLLAVNQLRKINNLGLLVGAGTNNGSRIGATADETAITIIEPSTNTINNIYIPQFSEYVYIHRAMDIDQKNNYIVLSGLKQNAPYIGTSHLMILDQAGNLVNEYDLLTEKGEHIINVFNIEVNEGIIYFSSGNSIFKIEDYYNGDINNPKPAVLMYTDPYGSFDAIALSPNKEYLVVSNLMSNGEHKIEIVPVNVTGISSQSYTDGIITLNGVVSYEPNARPYEFAFSDNYCFLSGFTKVYGFQFEAFGSEQSEKAIVKNNKATAATKANTRTISVSPNPTQININVLYSTTENEAATIQVYDNKGLLLLTKSINAVIGNNKFELNIASFAKGNYVVKVVSKKEVLATQFIKL